MSGTTGSPAPVACDPVAAGRASTSSGGRRPGTPGVGATGAPAPHSAAALAIAAAFSFSTSFGVSFGRSTDSVTFSSLPVNGNGGL